MKKIKWKTAIVVAIMLIVNCLQPLSVVAASNLFSVTFEQAKNAGRLIAAGYDHSMALKADGTVVAWGFYGADQCDVPSDLKDVVAIAAGSSHSMALKADGTVLAWGANVYGQCDAPSYFLKEIVAGSVHNIALMANGRVVAWGANFCGESTVPSDLKDVVAIAAGNSHSMALKADGTVEAWGKNDYGQSTVPSDLKDVVAIAAGGKHSMALKADGTVEAWGAGELGESGYDHYGQSIVPSDLKDVVAIAAGDKHSMALKTDGTVVAWGSNGYDQCDVPSDLKDVVAIAAGGNYSMALKTDGTVVAWGDNRSYQCNVPSDLDLAPNHVLNNLLINHGLLNSEFESNTYEYTVEVANSITSIELVPVLADDTKEITVQGKPCGNGSPANINLEVGSNNIEVTVQKPDEILRKAYTIVVNRAAPDPENAELFELKTSSGLWYKDFSSDIPKYTINVDSTVEQIDIIAITSDLNADMTINGQSYGGGEQTSRINLDNGINVIPITIRSSDGNTTKEYELTIIRGLSSNADLKDLQLSTGTLNEVFEKDKAIYSVTTNSDINTISITAETDDTEATFTIAGKTAESGVAKEVSLEHGKNLIPIIVTAEDGITEKAYIISINGTVSDADLSSLAIDGYLLSFDKDKQNYTLDVDNDITSIEISATASDEKALILIDGQILESGTKTIDLEVGEKDIDVMVVAQDATTKNYTIKVERGEALSIETEVLPIGMIDTEYNVSIQAKGGNNPYDWTVSGLPTGLETKTSASTKEITISGEPEAEGEYDVDISVRDSSSSTKEITKSFKIKIKKGCGNGGYLIKPNDDPSYTSGLTSDGIPIMTVNEAGFKYFSVNVTPVTGHPGKEVAIFEHMRNGTLIDVNTTKADFDTISNAQAGFNVKAGDVIKVYIVDDLTNDENSNPNVL